MTKTIYLLLVTLALGVSMTPAADALPLDNGLSFNGRNVNGRNINGLSFNGANMNGLPFNGTELDGDVSETAGLAMTIILKDGEEVTLR